MRNYLFLVSLLLIFACAKESVEKESKTCKLISYETSSTRKFRFEYFGDKIISITQNKPNETYEATLTYNASGKLSQSDVLFNGSDYFTETYSYTEDKISRIDIVYYDGFRGFKRLEYNSKGLLSKYTYEQEGQAKYPFSTFAYNSEGLLVETEDFQSEGVQIVKKVATPMNNIKSPETLLLAGGLPFDLLIGVPYTSKIGGDGTIIEFYYPNANGTLELKTVGTISQSETNANGMLNRNIISYTGDVNQINNSISNLMDCK